MYKSGRLLLIRTNKKSKLCLTGDRLMYDEVGFMQMPLTNIMPPVKPVNFYLVSESEDNIDEDEIKVGDYAILLTNVKEDEDITMCLTRADNELEAEELNRNINYKKVLASTEELTYFKMDNYDMIWCKLPRISKGKIDELLMLQHLNESFSDIIVKVAYKAEADYDNDNEEILITLAVNELNEVDFKIIKHVFSRDEVVDKIIQSNLQSNLNKDGTFDILNWIENNL